MNLSEQFIIMFKEDLENIKSAISDRNNIETPEIAKIDLYKDVTSKYYTVIPKLGDGLYSFFKDYGFFDEVTGDSLNHNLKQIYSKMNSFKALGYPLSNEFVKSKDNNLVVNAYLSNIVDVHNMSSNTNINHNEINNEIKIKFSEARNKVSDMSALGEVEIRDIMSKIDLIEEIVKSKDKKSVKWERAKEIIKWTADKGVDVGIALLPLLLTIS
ncbi:hypothetical protein [Fusibacter bizertensis]